MSWSIPAQIEKDFLSGKATYRTFQTGFGGQSILPVPSNAYVIIFGYDFSPAGGGFGFTSSEISSGAAVFARADERITQFEKQQISFYTGTDFYPFIHGIQSNIIPYAQRWNQADPANVTVSNIRVFSEIDSTPIARQVYITSHNDVTITHGLVKTTPRVSANNIPVTNRTPVGLTYGGSPQTMNTQTNLGPAATPLQFMQPSPKDYEDFGFGLLPNNADGQAFATPDATNGLQDATNALTGISPGNRDTAAPNYFLCVHYALYNRTVPEELG